MFLFPKWQDTRLADAKVVVQLCVILSLASFPKEKAPLLFNMFYPTP